MYGRYFGNGPTEITNEAVTFRAVMPEANPYTEYRYPIVDGTDVAARASVALVGHDYVLNRMGATRVALGVRRVRSTGSPSEPTSRTARARSRIRRDRDPRTEIYRPEFRVTVVAVPSALEPPVWVRAVGAVPLFVLGESPLGVDYR